MKLFWLGAATLSTYIIRSGCIILCFDIRCRAVSGLNGRPSSWACTMTTDLVYNPEGPELSGLNLAKA